MSIRQDSPDSLETVETFYRKAWPGAKEQPTDQGNLYVGISLRRGKDRIEIYRFGNMKSVSIDLLKYVGK